MNWTGIEGQWKQREGEVVHNWGESMNNELAIAGKHEQLVENLQEKYGIAKKGKPFDELFGEKIAQTIESLPNNFKSVVLLSDVEQLRYAEIAKTLACPVGTVCSRLHRGRKIVQQRLSNFSAVDGSILGKFEDSEDLQKDSFK
jgi:DNA-directed RNA polymerase specialized sigma24 family protein